MERQNLFRIIQNSNHKKDRKRFQIRIPNLNIKCLPIRSYKVTRSVNVLVGTRTWESIEYTIGVYFLSAISPFSCKILNCTALRFHSVIALNVPCIDIKVIGKHCFRRSRKSIIGLVLIYYLRTINKKKISKSKN